MSTSPRREMKPMILRNVAWVLLADARHGRLLCCGLTPQGRCHVDDCDSIQNDWPGHDHPRSSPLWKGTGVSYGIEDDEVREPTRRFARRVAAWAHHKMAQYEIEHIAILAPPHFLAALRDERSADLAGKAVGHQGEFTNVPTSELAKHPTIRELVGLDGSS